MIVVEKVDLWPHCVTTTYNNLDLKFVVDIPTKNTINKLDLSTTISAATQKAPSLMTTGLEQVCLSTTVIAEEAIHLGNNATVFQAAVLQWQEQHLTLYSLKSKMATSRAQAAIMAIENTKIKFKNTLDALLVLIKLGKDSQVLIR